jgi:hypothetical protein
MHECSRLLCLLAGRLAVRKDGNLLGSQLSDSRRGEFHCFIYLTAAMPIDAGSNGNEGSPEGRALDDSESRDPWGACLRGSY